MPEQVRGLLVCGAALTLLAFTDPAPFAAYVRSLGGVPELTE